MANVGIETMTERQLMAKIDAKLAKEATSKPRRAPAPTTIALAGGLGGNGGPSINAAGSTVRIDVAELATPVEITNSTRGVLKADAAGDVDVLCGESANERDFAPVIGPDGKVLKMRLKAGFNVIPEWVFSGAPFVRFAGKPQSARLYLRYGG